MLVENKMSACIGLDYIGIMRVFLILSCIRMQAAAINEVNARKVFTKIISKFITKKIRYIKLFESVA